MKLLFTIDESGSNVFNNVLGFADLDLKIEYLKPDIITATDELIELIGKDIYETIADISEANEPQETEADLLYRARLAIAVNAYRTFAPDNDISHTNSGRVQRIEQHQKTPWEWQIDRSNESLEKKYYRAVDALLLFLDENIPAWKATDAYKDTHDLFVRTTKDFDDYFNIGRSRLLFIKMAPGLRRAEASEIRPRVGGELFADMKSKLKNSEAVDEDLLGKIKEACVYKALAWAMGRLSVQLFPEGVLQFKSERLSTRGKMPTLKSEPEAAAQKFEQDANRVLLEIEEHIAKLNPVITPYRELDPGFCENDTFIST